MKITVNKLNTEIATFQAEMSFHLLGVSLNDYLGDMDNNPDPFKSIILVKATEDNRIFVYDGRKHQHIRRSVFSSTSDYYNVHGVESTPELITIIDCQGGTNRDLYFGLNTFRKAIYTANKMASLKS